MVIRAGETLTIPADQVVPGDLAVLETGQKVPADMRIISCSNLRVDKALLTGMYACMCVCIYSSFAFVWIVQASSKSQSLHFCSAFSQC